MTLIPPFAGRIAAVAAVLFVASSTQAAVPGKRPATRPGARALIIPQVPKDQQICFALYTVQRGVLKLSAQLYPLEDNDPREVRLELKQDGQWKQIAVARVRENTYNNAQWMPNRVSDKSWMVHFRVENWDAAKDVPYRLRHGESATLKGLVRRDPVDKDHLVVAAFTGNGNNDRRLKPDMIANLKAQDPDLLFFSGDQSYDHTNHLYAWLLFGRQYGELTKDRPTVCMPDDHDVGHGNLWGANGKKSASGNGDDGGYFMPVEYVNEVQFAQTSHMPDPYDPAPIDRGITVYYTALNVGRLSFAIVEDRKFKTQPVGTVPQRGVRPDWIEDPKYDPKSVDVPGAQLLGQRQMKFLRDWALDWRRADMKIVLSQTIFAGIPHIHHGKRLVGDLDSNGWPQTARNQALAEMRKCFAFHINGDQHLASVVHYGIETWNDAGWAFCVPSIVNYYPRSWDPDVEPNKAVKTALPKTGEYRDGFGNLITVLAYANPDPARANKWGGEWGAKADGYGLVRFDLKTRRIVMECWPRGVDATGPNAEQYPGWPVTVDQLDNYGREAVAWLPTLNMRGVSNPVVHVIDEATGETVYILRISGTSFRPKVFKPGKYTVKVGDGESRVKTMAAIESAGADDARSIEVNLD